MESKEPFRLPSPFGTSDLFLYTIPGATGLIAAFMFEMRAERAIAAAGMSTTSVHLPMYHAAEAIKADQFGQGLVAATVAIAVLLTLAYVVGHLVSSLSSLALDRVLLAKGHCYPFAALLDRTGEKRKGTPASKSQAYYRGLFCWLNIWAAAYLLWHLTERHRYLWASRLVCGLLVLAVMVKAADRRWRKPVENADLLTSTPKWVRQIVLVFSWPWDAPANVFAHWTRAREPMETKVIDKFEEKLFASFGVRIEEVGTSNAYWLAYLKVLTESKTFGKLMENWLHLYSFARNLSTAFYLAALYSGGLLAFQAATLREVNYGVLLWYPLAYAACALVFMSRYYYLYSCYYSRFIVRSFAFLDNLGSSAP